MSELYVISSPIGNLKDITLRAVETIYNLDILLCEDTRTTAKLINSFKINFPNIKTNHIPKLMSFHEHNELAQIPQILLNFKKGKKIGLISDAGTPIISDPGFNLVKQCIKRQIKIISIPGPSAMISALSISGLSPNPMLYLGFLPRKTSKLKNILRNIQISPLKQTVIIYESANRIKELIRIILNIFPQTKIVIAKELTKIHENIIYLDKNNLTDINLDLRGEIVLLFNS